MSLIAVCGYRGHGKDTLYQSLKSIVESRTPKYDAHIFHRPETSHLMSVIRTRKRVTRFASADVIKHQMCNIYQLTYDELERRKDTLIDDSSQTYRDVMKLVARTNLNNDRYCYVKEIEKCEVDAATALVVTDLRMRHEHDYLKTFARSRGLDFITVRVFRTDAPIPPKDDMTEHGLDDLVTDYFVGNCVDALSGFTDYLNIDDYFNRG